MSTTSKYTLSNSPCHIDLTPVPPRKLDSHGGLFIQNLRILGLDSEKGRVRARVCVCSVYVCVCVCVRARMFVFVFVCVFVLAFLC